MPVDASAEHRDLDGIVNGVKYGHDNNRLPEFGKERQHGRQDGRRAKSCPGGNGRPRQRREKAQDEADCVHVYIESRYRLLTAAIVEAYSLRVNRSFCAAPAAPWLAGPSRTNRCYPCLP